MPQLNTVSVTRGDMTITVTQEYIERFDIGYWKLETGHYSEW